MEDLEMKMLEDIGDNTGIYVVCNDKSLLENINGLLTRNGMLCVRDNSGKVSYLVDGRSDKSQAMMTVSGLMSDHFLGLGEGRDVYYEMCAKAVFMASGFDMSHTGTAVVYLAVKDVILGVQPRICIWILQTDFICHSIRYQGMSAMR